jgi:hypothetical protein
MEAAKVILAFLSGDFSAPAIRAGISDFVKVKGPILNESGFNDRQGGPHQEHL